jgi:hypothetical protein
VGMGITGVWSTVAWRPSVHFQTRRIKHDLIVAADRFWTNLYQGAFLMRGLANVRAKFSLTALAYNLRRALNILGVEAMIAGVAA